MTRFACSLIAIGLTGGTVAFGAVYRWAWMPLAALSLAAVGACWIATARVRERYSGLLLAILCVLLSIGLQLWPLDAATLEWLSPETARVLRQLDPAFALVSAPHTLSINPTLTRNGLLLGGAFLLLIPASARLFSVAGTRWLTYSLAALGAAMSVAAMAAKVTDPRLVWGFWKPELNYAAPFGPFVNGNHFAGWLLMALPITMAWVTGSVASRPPAASLRDRLLWFTSAAGAKTLLMLLAALLMAVALIFSGSRGAMVALVVGLVALGALAMREAGSSRSRILVLLPAVIVIALAAWTASASIEEQLYETDSPLTARVDAWKDAWQIGARFPLTGSGLNTYSTATLVLQQYNRKWHFAHAHNDYLQLAAEGGVLVGVPVLALLAVVTITIVRRFRVHRSRDWSWWARAGAVSALVAIALQEVGEFSLQMPANAYLCALVTGVAIHVPRQRQPRPQP